MRRARAAGGLQARRKLDRGQRKSASSYSLRGRVRCGNCGRRMEGTSRGLRIYYRCAARSIVPGSAVLATHPKIVYLPESAVVEPLNAWIGGLFAPDHREDTVCRLLDADATRADTARTAAADEAVVNVTPSSGCVVFTLRSRLELTPSPWSSRSIERRRSWKRPGSSSSACPRHKRSARRTWRRCSTTSAMSERHCCERIRPSWRICTGRWDWR
jgi:Recombinase zinc beta ribbon domain